MGKKSSVFILPLFMQRHRSLANIQVSHHCGWCIMKYPEMVVEVEALKFGSDVAIEL